MKPHKTFLGPSPKENPIRRVVAVAAPGAQCAPARQPRVEGTEAEDLLVDAERSFPSSDFVASVWDWFDENGFITDAQAEALRKIADRDY